MNKESLQPNLSKTVSRPDLPKAAEELETEPDLGITNLTSLNLKQNERGKTHLRIKYEAESKVIRNKLGSLEEIRAKLNLSQRKMCQLLLVDPSAWTRWIKDESKVPPHILRSLQWYLALIDKSPEWHPMNTYLGAIRTSQHSSDKTDEIKSDLQQLERQFHSTLNYQQKRLDETIRQNQIQWGWKFLILVNIMFWIWKILF